jgi:hypothetical protein
MRNTLAADSVHGSSHHGDSRFYEDCAVDSAQRVLHKNVNALLCLRETLVCIRSLTLACYSLVHAVY